MEVLTHHAFGKNSLIATVPFERESWAIYVMEELSCFRTRPIR